MINDIPCALSSRERSTLRRWCRDRRVVEAGALLGGSTVEIARAAVDVVSIDRHTGYDGTPMDTWRRYRSNLDRYRAYNVRPVKADVFDALPRYPREVAFIDLTGEFDVTYHALLACPASSVVLLHDCTRVNCEGVERAIRVSGLAVVEHTDTLAVCVR